MFSVEAWWLWPVTAISSSHTYQPRASLELINGQKQGSDPSSGISEDPEDQVKFTRIKRWALQRSPLPPQSIKWKSMPLTRCSPPHPRNHSSEYIPLFQKHGGSSPSLSPFHRKQNPCTTHIWRITPDSGLAAPVMWFNYDDWTNRADIIDFYRLTPCHPDVSFCTSSVL